MNNWSIFSGNYLQKSYVSNVMLCVMPIAFCWLAWITRGFKRWNISSLLTLLQPPQTKPTPTELLQFSQQCKAENVAEVRQMVQQWIATSLNNCDDVQDVIWTELYYAGHCGRVSIAKYLISVYMTIYQVDNDTFDIQLATLYLRICCNIGPDLSQYLMWSLPFSIDVVMNLVQFAVFRHMGVPIICNTLIQSLPQLLQPIPAIVRPYTIISHQKYRNNIFHTVSQYQTHIILEYMLDEHY
jgi:hypothetical protein